MRLPEGGPRYSGAGTTPAAEHVPRGTVCSCGWAPSRSSGAYTPRMAALLVEGHAETSNDPEPPAEDDR